MTLRKILVLLMAVAMVFAVLSCSKSETEPAEQTQQTQPADQETTVAVVDHAITQDEIGTEATCPVCGMNFEVDENTPAVEYGENVYYFCSPDDMAKFKADPDAVLNKDATEGGDEATDESTSDK